MYANQRPNRKRCRCTPQALEFRHPKSCFSLRKAINLPTYAVNISIQVPRYIPFPKLSPGFLHPFDSPKNSQQSFHLILKPHQPALILNFVSGPHTTRQWQQWIYLYSRHYLKLMNFVLASYIYTNPALEKKSLAPKTRKWIWMATPCFVTHACPPRNSCLVDS